MEFAWFFVFAGLVCPVAVWEVLCEAAAADEDWFVLWFDFDWAVEVVADESWHVLAPVCIGFLCGAWCCFECFFDDEFGWGLLVW